MPKKQRGSGLGNWAFLLGLILAVIIGLWGKVDKTIAIILVVLGLLIGLLNVRGKETTHFLLASTVLVIVSALGGGVLENIIWLKGILDAILILCIPATIIVALKVVFAIARR